MAVKLKRATDAKLKEHHHHKHHTKSKVDSHDQEVVDLMKLLPLGTFDDGIESSAFTLNPKLLEGFVEAEMGGLISGLSNGFDFGFDAGF